MIKKLFKNAFKATFPVFLGYLSIGFAFGIMLQDVGYNFVWAAFMSLVIYAGSMEYVAVSFLASQTSFEMVALTSLIVQARHMVYGLSLIDKFKNMGKLKPYMIFSLTDETYALLSSVKTPSGVPEKWFNFTVAALNQIYWILGGVLGALANSFININTKGIDFAMTALFVVILTEQVLTYPSKAPAAIGGACALASLMLIMNFTSDRSNMLIPAIILILMILIAGRSRLEPVFQKNNVSEAGGR